MAQLPKNYYINPSFSQQSEFINHAKSVRQSPVGAQAAQQYQEDECDEQDFYEEMLVDSSGIIKEKKVLVVSSPSQENRYQRRGHQQARYEYIPMQEQPQGSRYMVVHPKRYEDVAYGRPQHHRYEYIPDDYSPNRSIARYEYVQTPTQKLHELLTTPKKSPRTMVVPNSRMVRSPQSQRREPFVAPKTKSRAQQKLNYAIGTRHHQQVPPEKRHTAIIAPMCSSPIQSVYSETTTMSNGTESWMNLSIKKPTQITLAAAAVMMMLCGTVTSGLCFYMVSIMGRLYFLDFGIIAGFTCLVLGLLGFRTRNCYWLPNRNYISGYILLSVLSLLMCAGLLVLMVMRPRPGTPIADITSGAICGISVLSITLASVGVMTSYCCKYPPPDNRVQHTAQGFTV